MKSMLLALCAVILLSACAFEPIVDVANENSVSVRYDPMLVSIQTAAKTAEDHCRSINRLPRLMMRGYEGSWLTLTYHCVP